MADVLGITEGQARARMAILRRHLDAVDRDQFEDTCDTSFTPRPARRSFGRRSGKTIPALIDRQGPTTLRARPAASRRH